MSTFSKLINVPCSGYNFARYNTFSLTVPDKSIVTGATAYINDISMSALIQAYIGEGFRQTTYSYGSTANVTFDCNGIKRGTSYTRSSILSLGSGPVNNWTSGGTWNENGYSVRFVTSDIFPTDSKTAVVNIYLDAYSVSERDYDASAGSYYEGRNTASYNLGTVTLELDAPPTCSYTQLSDVSGKSQWIQNLSVARTTISNVSAKYGGSISSVKLIVGSSSASISGNGNIDVPILDSGTLTPQIVVTDSRGQTTSYTLNPITVMAYQKPSIESIELERHVPLGEQDETQVYINATIKQTPISGNSMGVPEVLVGGNDISDEIVWYNEPTHETVYNSTTAASKNIYGVVNDSEVFATGSTYNFTLSISDAFSTSESKTEVLPTVFVTMDFQAGGKEIAFGDKADDDLTEYENGLFKCGMSILNLPMIGEIKMWAGNTIPQGWLLCDGSEVSKTTYPRLFAAIGNLWGTPSSSSNFKLPNLNGRAPVGYDSTDTAFDAVGKTGGEKTHTLSLSEMPSHEHPGNGWSFSVYKGTQSAETVGSISGSGYKMSQVNSSGTWGGYANVPAAGGGQPHNNMQPYAVVKYIICAI